MWVQAISLSCCVLLATTLHWTSACYKERKLPEEVEPPFEERPLEYGSVNCTLADHIKKGCYNDGYCIYRAEFDGITGAVFRVLNYTECECTPDFTGEYCEILKINLGSPTIISISLALILVIIVGVVLIHCCVTSRGKRLRRAASKGMKEEPEVATVATTVMGETSRRNPADYTDGTIISHRDSDGFDPTDWLLDIPFMDEATPASMRRF